MRLSLVTPLCPHQTLDSCPPLSLGTDSRSGLLVHFGASCQGSEQSVDDRSAGSTVKREKHTSQRNCWAHGDTPSFLLKNITLGMQLLGS